MYIYMNSSSSSLSNTKKQTKIYMEYSRPDQWLKHVVPKDREWEAISESKRRHNNGDGGVLFLSEEKKLELRLGPPGEDPRSLYSSSMADHGDGGAKRGYHEEEGTFVEAKPWPPPPPPPAATATATADCTFTLPSSYSSPSALVLENQQQQQQPKPSYPVFDSFSKPFPCPSTHDQLQLLQYYKDKMSSSVSAANANTAVPNTSHSHKRIEHAPIVGWPPVRSFRRKNLVKYKYSGPSSWKAASESLNKIIPKETSGGYEKSESSKPGLFVKINMDGLPIGRKVDLKACDSYEKLSYPVHDLFGALLSAAQKEASPADT